MSQQLSIASLLAWGKGQLAAHESAALDTRVLLCHCLGESVTYLMTWPERCPDASQITQFEELVALRRQGQPIAHLTGVREFWSMDLLVSPQTLIPRPDTEILVEHALALPLADSANVLDLGTGTGAIALALASERAGWQITAVDVKEQAVALALRNAQRLGLERVRVCQSNWFAAVKGQRFDLIVSNPPYVEEDSPYLRCGDVRFEPASALTSGKNGLNDITRIVEQSQDYLRPRGWLMIEHGFEQGCDVSALFTQHQFNNVATLKDLSGQDRATIGQNQ